jgi:ParB family chromosome partitioning protein
MVEDRLAAEAGQLQKQGWKWTQIVQAWDWSLASKMQRLQPVSRGYSVEDQADLERIDARLAEIENIEDSMDDPELDAEWEQLTDQREAILKREIEEYAGGDMARAGCFITLDESGAVKIMVGFVRPEDQPKPEPAKKKAKAATKDGDDDNGMALSLGLRDDLSRLRQAILRAEFLQNPEIARDLLNFQLARRVLRGRACGAFRLQTGDISENEHGARSLGACEAFDTFDKALAQSPIDWAKIEDDAESFRAYCALAEAQKTALQALIAAHLLIPQLSDDRPDMALETAAAMIGVDPARHWTPSEGFFSRLKRDQLIEIARDVIGGDFMEVHGKAKKSVLVKEIAEVFEHADTIPDAQERERIKAWSPDCLRPGAAPSPAPLKQAA